MTVDGRREVDALIMKGGGVKGLAFAGALQELERYYVFRSYVGTSAGAIAAALLAVGYSGRDLETILRQKDFREFKDAGRFRSVANLLLKGGLYPGTTLRNWLRGLLNDKLGTVESLRLSLLKDTRLIIYASLATLNRTLIFDSAGENANHEIDFAVRCSMSIPVVFWPQSHDAHTVYDGGLINNFPVREYLNTHRESTFVALYLGSKSVPEVRSTPTWLEVYNIVMGRDDLRVLEEYRDRSVIIDPRPIRTIDFSLTEEEKELLLARGRCAAREYLNVQGLLSTVDREQIPALQRDVTELHGKVVKRRRARRRNRIAALVIVMVAGILATVPVTRAGALGLLAGVLSKKYPCSTEPAWRDRAASRLRGRSPAEECVRASAAEDFSLAINPSKGWSYGFFDGEQFVFYTTTSKGKAAETGSAELWHARQTADSIPSLGKRFDGFAGVFASSYGKGFLILHPGWRGQRSAVRWSAPRSGRYMLQFDTVGASDCVKKGGGRIPSTADVALRTQGIELYGEEFSETRLDGRFHGEVELVEGGTVEVSVGIGGKSSSFCDSVGVRLEIRER